MNLPEKPTLTVSEAAAWLGVSAPTVYRMINARVGIPVLRVGARMRIPTQRFLEWLNSVEAERATFAAFSPHEEPR